MCNVETCNMHGEGGQVQHEVNNDVGRREDFNESTDLNIPLDCGPNNPVEKQSGPKNVFGEEGPTPVGNLGKRNREERSPPSFGSMQGPAQRPLFHVQNSLDAQFDLNSPFGDRYGLEEMFTGSPGLGEVGCISPFQCGGGGGELPLMRLQGRSVPRSNIPSRPT
ncbi:hypothetical protein Hanom_Chr01g00089301 [Helianthus anomalus]